MNCIRYFLYSNYQEEPVPINTQVPAVPVSTPPVAGDPTVQTSSDRVATGRTAESNDGDSKVPLWKRNLMRKRQKEEEQKQSKQMNEVYQYMPLNDNSYYNDIPQDESATEDKYADVPEWKKKILMKKEEQRQ